MLQVNQTFIATRPFTARGRTYKTGEVVDLTGWPHRRAELLESRRFVRRSVAASRTYIALRDFRTGDDSYKKGDEVNKTRLPQAKLDQLLDLRFVTYTDTPSPQKQAERPATPSPSTRPNTGTAQGATA